MTSAGSSSDALGTAPVTWTIASSERPGWEGRFEVPAVVARIRCHRGALSQYLAVRSKGDYREVPVTEEVPEFYRCPSYEPRRQGTSISWFGGVGSCSCFVVPTPRTARGCCAFPAGTSSVVRLGVDRFAGPSPGLDVVPYQDAGLAGSLGPAPFSLLGWTPRWHEPTSADGVAG